MLTKDKKCKLSEKLTSTATTNDPVDGATLEAADQQCDNPQLCATSNELHKLRLQVVQLKKENAQQKEGKLLLENMFTPGQIRRIFNPDKKNTLRG
ncbi:hypothetical protein CHUAL_009535 [Chamberlinius hualienensis]